MLDLTGIAAIDNHCHLPLEQPPPGVEPELARYFTEAHDPEVLSRHTPHSLFFRRALRDLAPLVGMETGWEDEVDAAELLARRAAFGAEAWFKLVVEKANLGALLFDTGYPRAGAWTVERAGKVLEASRVQVRPILRLERVLEDLILSLDNFSQCEEAFRQAIRGARAAGAVALKSVIAYRTGLDVQPEKTSASLAGVAFERLKEETRRTGTYARVAEKELLDYLLPAALEEAARLSLPVQIHCGFGDTDLDLVRANPAMLRPLLEDSRYRSAPLVLLHCYPYLQEAAYLASVYPQVYLDFSLASPLVAFGGGHALEDALGLAPATKILYGSDAWGIPDILYLGALHTRKRLDEVLSAWIETGWLSRHEALTVATRVLQGNARELYGL